MRRDTEEGHEEKKTERGKGRKKRASIDPVCACACTAARNKTPWCYQNSRDAVALV